MAIWRVLLHKRRHRPDAAYIIYIILKCRMQWYFLLKCILITHWVAMGDIFKNNPLDRIGLGWTSYIVSGLNITIRHHRKILGKTETRMTSQNLRWSAFSQIGFNPTGLKPTGLSVWLIWLCLKSLSYFRHESVESCFGQYWWLLNEVHPDLCGVASFVIITFIPNRNLFPFNSHWVCTRYWFQITSLVNSVFLVPEFRNFPELVVIASVDAATAKYFCTEHLYAVVCWWWHRPFSYSEKDWTNHCGHLVFYPKPFTRKSTQ